VLRAGVDIIEIERIDRAILRHGNRFFDRFFTSRELIESGGRTPALAARYAAKEAVAKALGTGIGKVGWKEIEVINGPDRQPLLWLHGRAQEEARLLGLEAWSLSLSHTHEHAVAFVTALQSPGARSQEARAG
jgi:holo-[acyl-carrier protein] synthase